MEYTNTDLPTLTIETDKGKILGSLVPRIEKNIEKREVESLNSNETAMRRTIATWVTDELDKLGKSFATSHKKISELAEKSASLNKLGLNTSMLKNGNLLMDLINQIDDAKGWCDEVLNETADLPLFSVLDQSGKEMA